MQKITLQGLITLLIILLNTNIVSSQIQASFYASAFNDRENGSYIETYVSVSGNTLNYVKTEGNLLQATVDITLIFKNIDGIKEFRKYKATQIYNKKEDEVIPDVTDMQRIFIPQGVYNFTLIISDMNNDKLNNDFVYADILTVDFPTNTLSISDVQLISSYVKSEAAHLFLKDDYKLIPYYSNTYNADNDYLRFYLELYNASKDLGALNSFWLEAYLQDIKTHKPLHNFRVKTTQKALNKNKWLSNINIHNLPTGNYFLTINVRDKNNKILVTKQKLIVRNNVGAKALSNKGLTANVQIKNTFVETMDADSLSSFIKSLYYICDANEKDYLAHLSEKTLTENKQFFYKFWFNRYTYDYKNQWLKYKDLVNNAVLLFSNEDKAPLKTDRARIYLQYGQPGEITHPQTKDATAVYEVWKYYKIADLTNRKFLFRKDAETNTYKLIKTDMPGESLKTE